MAVKFKIPLIVWGAHQGLDQVGMFSHPDEVEMTRKYRKEHDLMGLESRGSGREFDGLAPADVGRSSTRTTRSSSGRACAGST